MATVLTLLWIADRLLSPILELERCRREVCASLVVATSLSNNIARLAGRGDVDALNALRDARKGLLDVSSGFEDIREWRREQVDDGDVGRGVSVPAGTGSCGLEDAIQAFETGVGVG